MNIANTVPVILTDEKQAKRFAEKVLSASEKVKQWFEKLLKDLRAILDKAYNALKREKSWEQMELIRNNKQTLDMIADYYFEGMEGTKATNSDSAQSIIFSAKDADITSKQKAEYDEYVQNALAGAGNNANSSFDLAYASERLINDLKKQGADVSGYRHRIQDNDIRHIRNSHGISKEGAYGVTTGDLQAIPYIINNYTDVRARIRNGKLYGVVYALDHVDTTYYVEGDVKGRFLDGKQMIKVPLGHVPEEYRAEFGKKRSISEYPDKASSDVPETYVQDGQQSHASINNMPQTSEDVKFSRKDDVSVTAKDVQKLQKENDKLTQALDLVRQELKITQGHHVKPAVIDRLAGRILTDYQSTMPKAELVESITQLFDYIGNGERVIWDEVQAGAMNIALNVLDKSTQRNTEWYDATKPARDYLKDTAIKLNDKQLEEVGYAFGSYNDFRRALFGKATVSRVDGIPLEQAWRDLSGMFPDVFDPDTADVDMPVMLYNEVLGMYDRPIENPYGYDLRGYASDLAMQLYDAYMSAPEVNTFADKQQKKLDLTKAH